METISARVRRKNNFILKVVTLSVLQTIYAMKTTERQLTPEERQANVSKLIARWKETKKQSEEETKARVKTPEYQAILKELRERNAAKGIVIPD